MFLIYICPYKYEYLFPHASLLFLFICHKIRSKIVSSSSWVENEEKLCKRQVWMLCDSFFCWFPIFRSWLIWIFSNAIKLAQRETQIGHSCCCCALKMPSFIGFLHKNTKISIKLWYCIEEENIYEIYTYVCMFI